MGIFGVMYACANNAQQVSGIAIGTRAFPVKIRAPISAFSYVLDTLRWMSGLDVPCPQVDPLHPDDPLRKDQRHPCHWEKVPATDVPVAINGSYGIGYVNGVAKIPDSSAIRSAFETITTVARGGKGVILVFAAGNDGRQDVSLVQPFAADPASIAVGNCMISGRSGASCQDTTADVCLDPGIQNKYAASNVGSKIELCALGRDSETISPYCDHGLCVIGGTSAAAATVSAVLALMASVNANLSVTDAREILASTSEKIDPSKGLWEDSRSAWYGHGLLNACSAVRMSAERGGRATWADDPCK